MTRSTWPTPAASHGAAVLLLALMAWMADSSAAYKSPTFDETAGIVSGFLWWETGDARLDPENGLLAKRLAALPVWLSGAQPPDLTGPAWETGFDWGLGRELLYGAGNDPALVMRSARRTADTSRRRSALQRRRSWARSSRARCSRWPPNPPRAQASRM